MHVRVCVPHSRMGFASSFSSSSFWSWCVRYSPQSNWGQSLAYRRAGQDGRAFADFDEIAEAFGELVAQGKVRG